MKGLNFIYILLSHVTEKERETSLLSLYVSMEYIFMCKMVRKERKEIIIFTQSHNISLQIFIPFPTVRKIYIKILRRERDRAKTKNLQLQETTKHVYILSSRVV